MRTFIFIMLYHVAFSYAPSAFSNSSLQSGSKDKVSKAPVDAISQHDWTGFYTGWILGAQFGHSSDKTGDFGYNADNDKWSYNEAGLNVGATFGYNYAVRRFFIGPEIELGYLDTRGSGAQPLSPGHDTVGKSRSDFYTALRARVGVDHDRYLLFATGGAIGLNSGKQIVDDCDIAPCGGGTVNAQKNSFNWGYTIGGGVERWFYKSWLVKLEYLYFNLAKQRFSGTTNLETTYDWTGQTSGNIIRVGLICHPNLG